MNYTTKSMTKNDNRQEPHKIITNSQHHNKFNADIFVFLLPKVKTSRKSILRRMPSAAKDEITSNNRQDKATSLK